MTDVHPVARTLLALLDNQVARTHAALDELPDALGDHAPGADCNSIRAIGAHLLVLRRFQLALLESPLASAVEAPTEVAALDDLARALDDAAALVRTAITTHDPDDWLRVPDPPREGKWGDEPTLHRFARPFNDFVNHLGAIRAIRRQAGAPAPRTQ